MNSKTLISRPTLLNIIYYSSGFALPTFKAVVPGNSKRERERELHAHLFIKRHSFWNNYAYTLRKERKKISRSPPQEGKKTQDLKGVKRQEVNSSYLVSSASGNGSWFQPK